MALSKKKRIEKLNENIGKSNTEALVMLHFYNPIGKGDWFITALYDFDEMGEPIFEGIVYMESIVWSKFKESDLKKTKLPFNQKIKHNPNFIPCSISDLINRIENGGDYRP